MMDRDDKLQRLRNELGIVTKHREDFRRDKQALHKDNVAQRETMQAVLALLDSGQLRDAADTLRDALEYRDRQRTPRGEKRRAGV